MKNDCQVAMLWQCSQEYFVGSAVWCTCSLLPSITCCSTSVSLSTLLFVIVMDTAAPRSGKHLVWSLWGTFAVICRWFWPFSPWPPMFTVAVCSWVWHRWDKDEYLKVLSHKREDPGDGGATAQTGEVKDLDSDHWIGTLAVLMQIF